MRNPLISLSAILYFSTVSLLGAIPRSLNYQGKLVDSLDVGINDTLAMTFRLYTSEVGGAPLWEQTIDSVIISRGLFSVGLSGFPDSVNFASEYWIETEVEGEVLAPRRKLSAVPYAFSAVNTENAIYSIRTPGTAPRRGNLIIDAGTGTTLTDYGDSIRVVFSCVGGGGSDGGWKPANLWRSVMNHQFTFNFVSCSPVTLADSVFIYEVPAGNTLYLYGLTLSTSVPWGNNTGSLTLRNSYAAVTAGELLATDQWGIGTTAEREIIYPIPVKIPGGTRLYNKVGGYFYGTGGCGENRYISITSSVVFWGYLTE